MYYNEIEKQNTIKLREQLNTLPPFCKNFFRSLELRTTSRTRLAYAYDLSVFFDYLKKNNPLCKKEITLEILDSLTATDFEEFMEYLKYYTSNQNQEKTNSPISIKRKMSCIKTFYNYFYKNEFIKNNPPSKVLMPKTREKEIIRLETDEVSQLLDTVENNQAFSKKMESFHEKTKIRDLAILTLLLGTGIRVSECVGINLKDIDLKNNAIKIIRKGGKEVLIYFSDEVKEALEKYINERQYVKPLDDIDNDALFLSLQNKRMCQRSIQKLVKKYASVVTPLKHITPHKLRSTYGTNLYRETNDIYLVADVLGHNDVNTTKKHYAAITEDKRKNARNIVKLRDDDENN